MTDDLKAPDRLCYVNCGLPDDQCVCYQYAMSRDPAADRIATLEAALADMTRQRDAAMAGAVRVEACARKADEHYAAGDMGNPGHHIRALSTLSPIAAAARVLLADDVAISRMAEAIHDGPLGAEGHWFSAATEQGGWCVDVVRAGLRALAEQEKADD